jgi:hypothetical protein
VFSLITTIGPVPLAELVDGAVPAASIPSTQLRSARRQLTRKIPSTQRRNTASILPGRVSVTIPVAKGNQGRYRPSAVLQSPSKPDTSVSTKRCISHPPSRCSPAAISVGSLPEPGGWNRFALEVSDLAATVEELRKAGAHIRNDIVTGV